MNLICYGCSAPIVGPLECPDCRSGNCRRGGGLLLYRWGENRLEIRSCVRCNQAWLYCERGREVRRAPLCPNCTNGKSVLKFHLEIEAYERGRVVRP